MVMRSKDSHLHSKQDIRVSLVWSTTKIWRLKCKQTSIQDFTLNITDNTVGLTCSLALIILEWRWCL